MIDIQSKIIEAVNMSVGLAHEIADLFKAEWDARKDIAKTLISLSGATLVFTITFSQSVIKPDTPLFWRYAFVVCWLTFILSLALSFASLWFSMGLSSLPLLMTENTQKIKDAAKEAIGIGKSEPLVSVFLQPFKKITKQEKIALWLLRLSVLCYGLALSIFIVIGVRQLLR